MSTDKLSDNTKTFITQIEDWFGSSYNYTDDKFYEKNDHGVLPDVCQRSMDAVRGAHFASALLPTQKTVDDMNQHHEDHEDALLVAEMGIKDLYGRLAMSWFVLTMFFAAWAWVVWDENIFLGIVSIAAGIVGFGIMTMSFLRTRIGWAYMILSETIKTRKRKEMGDALQAPSEKEATPVDQKEDLQA